jgi:hypothetical protein
MGASRRVYVLSHMIADAVLLGLGWFIASIIIAHWWANAWWALGVLAIITWLQQAWRLCRRAGRTDHIIEILGYVIADLSILGMLGLIGVVIARWWTGIWWVFGAITLCACFRRVRYCWSKPDLISTERKRRGNPGLSRKRLFDHAGFGRFPISANLWTVVRVANAKPRRSTGARRGRLLFLRGTLAVVRTPANRRRARRVAKHEDVVDVDRAIIVDSSERLDDRQPRLTARNSKEQWRQVLQRRSAQTSPMPPRSTAPVKLPSPGESLFSDATHFFPVLLAIVFVNLYAKNNPIVSAWKANCAGHRQR